MSGLLVKEEVAIKDEPLEQAILPLLDHAYLHNDQLAAIRLIKVEALLLEERNRRGAVFCKCDNSQSVVIECKSEEGSCSSGGIKDEPKIDCNKENLRPRIPQPQPQEVVTVSESFPPEDVLDSVPSDQLIEAPNKELPFPMISDYEFENIENMLEEELSSDDGSSDTEKDKKGCHVCDICYFKTQALVQFKAHMRSHKGEKLYDCYICPYSTNKYDHLQSHMKSKLCGKEFACSVSACLYVSNDSTKLATHLRDQHPDVNALACTKCPFVARSAKGLSSHRHTHRNQDGEPCFVCSKCPFRCGSEQTLKGHISRDHKLHCDLCPYTTTVEMYLRNHKLKKHAPAKEKLCCDLCSYSTMVEAHFTSHKAKKHPPAKEILSCDMCSYSTTVEKCLVNHKSKKHQPKEKFNCNLCFYSTIQSGLYKVHMQSHSDRIKPVKKKFNCDSCSFSATVNINLTAHKSKKHAPTKERLSHNLTSHSGTEKDHHIEPTCSETLKPTKPAPPVAKCVLRVPSNERQKPIKYSTKLQFNQCRAAKERFSCDGCPYWTTVESYLIRHKSKQHQPATKSLIQDLPEEAIQNPGAKRSRRRVVSGKDLTSHKLNKHLEVKGVKFKCILNNTECSLTLDAFKAVLPYWRPE